MWPEVAKVLQAALDLTEGRWTADDVWSRVEQEQFQLWVFEIGHEVKTVCITHVHNYPRCRALQIVFIAGEGYGLWPHWFKDLSRWAKSIGCKFVEGDGRFGWEREMKSIGLRKIGSRYSMEIKDG